MNDYISLGQGPKPQGLQVQYYSQYIEGFGDKPALGRGLRFINLSTGCYHDIKIHEDDAQEFCDRVSFWLNLNENCAELGEELQALAQKANAGRGHRVSLDVAHLLQAGRVGAARATAFNESDKFDWVPDLKNWIARNLFSHGEENPWNLREKGGEQKMDEGRMVVREKRSLVWAAHALLRGEADAIVTPSAGQEDPDAYILAKPDIINRVKQILLDEGVDFVDNGRHPDEEGNWYPFLWVFDYMYRLDELVEMLTAEDEN